ncbi:hypothetical protein DRP04_01735 [Archaeoglobales archaeon]|nr:MAG: hypothetical protein DRP04_01735 [Archaeoglobales archaeon]
MSNEVIDEKEAPWVYKILVLILELGKDLKCPLCRRMLVYLAEHIIRFNYYTEFMENGMSFEEAVDYFELEYREGIEELLMQLREKLGVAFDEKQEKRAKSRLEAILKLAIDDLTSLSSSSPAETA